jgi:hypothetical protein
MTKKLDIANATYLKPSEWTVLKVWDGDDAGLTTYQVASDPHGCTATVTIDAIEYQKMLEKDTFTIQPNKEFVQKYLLDNPEEVCATCV